MGPRPLSGTPAPIPSCNMEDDEEDVAKEACLQNYISFWLWEKNRLCSGAWGCPQYLPVTWWCVELHRESGWYFEFLQRHPHRDHGPAKRTDGTPLHRCDNPATTNYADRKRGWSIGAATDCYQQSYAGIGCKVAVLVLHLTLYYLAYDGCTLVACGSEHCNPNGDLPGGLALFRGGAVAARVRQEGRK